MLGCLRQGASPYAKALVARDTRFDEFLFGTFCIITQADIWRIYTHTLCRRQPRAGGPFIIEKLFMLTSDRIVATTNFLSPCYVGDGLQIANHLVHGISVSSLYTVCVSRGLKGSDCFLKPLAFRSAKKWKMKHATDTRYLKRWWRTTLPSTCTGSSRPSIRESSTEISSALDPTACSFSFK